MEPGWFPDPTHRFPARYHDGTDWTDRVQASDGRVTEDRLDRTSTGLPGPAVPGPPPPSAGSTATATPAAPSSAAPRAGGPGRTAWNGVAVAAVGVLLAVLSLLALDWVADGSLSDIREAMPSSLPSGAELPDQVAHAYVQWLGWVLLVAVIATLVAAAISRQNAGAWITAAAVAALAAVLHTATVVRLFRFGGDVEIGAHLATVGYLVVIAGLAVGAAPKAVRT